MTRRTRLLVGAAFVVVSVGWTLATADRVTVRLMGSMPDHGQSVATAPERVRLNLSSAIDPARSHVRVFDGDGRRVDGDRVTAEPGNGIGSPVDIDGPGTYTIDYHVVGATGGQTSGQVRFAVGGRLAETATDVGDHDHGVDPLSAVLLLANLVTVVVAGALLLRRPAPRAPAG